MNFQHSLIYACAAMFLLTVFVSVRMYNKRVTEMKEKKIHPQSVADSVQVGAKLVTVHAADNYKNLFEMPVLFYLLCVLVLQTGVADLALILGVWLYVVLRYVHSYVHCTYNKVIHRFSAFVASGAVLFALWLYFVFRIAMQ